MENINIEIEDFIYKYLKKKHFNFYILGDIYSITYAVNKKSPSLLGKMIEELPNYIANNLELEIKDKIHTENFPHNYKGLFNSIF